jgi:ubiquinone biosynthesis protein UbiJ
MTKEQEQQDLSEALREASRVVKEKQRAYEKFLGSSLREGLPQGHNKNELKRASEELREAKEKYAALQALFEKVSRK